MTSKLFDLGGKVAIFTGGNGGIGLGMARGLAEAGALSSLRNAGTHNHRFLWLCGVVAPAFHEN